MLITTFSKEFLYKQMVQPDNDCTVDCRRDKETDKNTEREGTEGVKTLNENVS